jgi:hypothetical protein
VELALSVSLEAGSEVSPERNTAPRDFHLYQRGHWEFSLESTYSFSVISNPFHSIYSMRLITRNPIHYHFASQLLAVRYRLTNAEGPWWLRGSLESSATLVGTSIFNGPESYFVGLALGLRYDFVQVNARLVPFIEMRSGPGTTDSTGGRYAEQQDLVFTYLATAGLRYDVSRRWSVTASAIDQHLSNAHLAPENWGVDSLGVSVGFFARF